MGSFTGQNLPLRPILGPDQLEPLAGFGPGNIVANREIQKKGWVYLKGSGDFSQRSNGRRGFSTFYLRNVSGRNTNPGLDIFEGKALGKAELLDSVAEFEVIQDA